MEDAEGTSQLEKLAWLRTFIKSKLEGDDLDDAMSFHSGISLLVSEITICVVIVIQGYEPIAIDYFATKRASEIKPKPEHVAT